MMKIPPAQENIESRTTPPGYKVMLYEFEEVKVKKENKFGKYQ